MGSLFSARVFENCSEKVLMQKIRQECDLARMESGGSCSGNWGVKNPDSVEVAKERFVCSYSARSWLEDNTHKKGPIRAVKFLGGADRPETPEIDAQIKQVKRKIADLEFVLGVRSSPRSKNLVPFKDEAFKKAISGGGLILCDVCGSHVSSKHLKSADCPVCGIDGFVYSFDDKVKWGELNEQLQKNNEALNELKKERGAIVCQLADDTDWMWLVGAMCEW